MNPNLTFWHRVKSGLSFFIALAAGAFFVAIFSDEGFKAIGNIQTWVGSVTGSATAATLIGIFLREMWAQWKTKRNIEKASDNGTVGARSSTAIEQF